MKVYHWLIAIALGTGELHSAKLTGRPWHASGKTHMIGWGDTPTNTWPTRVWVYRTMPAVFTHEFTNHLFAITGLSPSNTARPPHDKKIVGKTGNFFISKDGNKRLGIYPDVAWVTYSDDQALPRGMVALTGVPSLEETLQAALEITYRLGIPESEFARKPGATSFWITASTETIRKSNPRSGKSLQFTNAQGVHLKRQLDGFAISGLGREGGFSLQPGGEKRIQKLELVWPQLERVQQLAVPSPRQVLRAISSGRLLADRHMPDLYPEMISIRRASIYYLGREPNEPHGEVRPCIALEMEQHTSETVFAFTLNGYLDGPSFYLRAP